MKFHLERVLGINFTIVGHCFSIFIRGILHCKFVYMKDVFYSVIKANLKLPKQYLTIYRIHMFV